MKKNEKIVKLKEEIVRTAIWCSRFGHEMCGQLRKEIEKLESLEKRNEN